MTSENRKPATGQDGNEDKGLLESEEYQQIAAMLQAPQGLLSEETLIRNIAARLTLLEEHFARICTVVGKLSQELCLLKGEKPDGQV